MTVKKAEIYLIGERINRIVLIMQIVIGMVIGSIIGYISGKVIFAILFIPLIVSLLIIITKKLYWIISNNGIYTPWNFGIVKYIIVMIEYAIFGNDKDNLVFIDYRDIKYLNLLDKNEGLGIQVVKNDNQFFSIILKSELFNQDLINSIQYIKRKGVKIKQLDILDKVKCCIGMNL